MYQKICYSNISSGFIKDMKIDHKKKVKKSWFDTSSIDAAIDD